MGWPVCARMDDANEKGARWRQLPAPGGGCVVNRPATSCRDPSNCSRSDWSICPWLPHCALPQASDSRDQGLRLVGWPLRICLGPCELPQPLSHT